MNRNQKNITSLEEILLKEIHLTEKKLNLPKNLLSFILEGKRIRAKLLNSSLNSRSADSLRIVLSSSIELTHASSLIHDDIVDESELRRGSRTTYSLLPVASASSIGYFMFSRIFLQLIRLNPYVYKHYFRTLSEMCIGQILEINTMSHKNASIRKYIQTIRYKTGSLFAFCFGIKEDTWNDRDSSIGYKFGTAFQILDDLYDVTLDEKTSGKTSMIDIKRGIYTLPFLYGKTSSSKRITNDGVDAAKKKALSILQNIDFNKLPKDWYVQLIELINRINSVSYNTSHLNRDNSKNSQPLYQTGE